MKKYVVEGGIDFFAELYKSLDDEENNHKTDEDNNICLITNKPLTDKFVEMNCGHKFNYLPLYNDLLNHKNKFHKIIYKRHLHKLNTGVNFGKINIFYSILTKN